MGLLARRGVDVELHDRTSVERGKQLGLFDLTLEGPLQDPAAFLDPRPKPLADQGRHRLHALWKALRMQVIAERVGEIPRGLKAQRGVPRRAPRGLERRVDVGDHVPQPRRPLLEHHAGDVLGGLGPVQAARGRALEHHDPEE